MTYAPDDLLAVRRYVQGKTGLDPASLGIAGDRAHASSGGYHEGHDDLHAAGRAPEDAGSDYSYTESSRDRSGLTDGASAFDLGNFSATVNGRAVTQFDVQHAVLAAVAAGDPRVRDLREMIYSPDGKTVRRWDRLKVRTTGDDSHLWHTHFSFFRDSEGRRSDATNFLGLLTQVFDGTEGINMAQLDDIQTGVDYTSWRTASFGNLGAVQGGPEKGGTYPLVTKLNKLFSDVDHLAVGGVDLNTLAALVAAKLAVMIPTAEQIAQAVAVEEAKRLGNG